MCRNFARVLFTHPLLCGTSSRWRFIETEFARVEAKLKQGVPREALVLIILTQDSHTHTPTAVHLGFPPSGHEFRWRNPVL